MKTRSKIELILEAEVKEIIGKEKLEKILLSKQFNGSGGASLLTDYLLKLERYQMLN